MNRSALAATPLLLALSGCLTGGNVKGDFQCQAPGGTCAPMSSIDAAAVAAIGSVRTISDPGATTRSIPRPLAGPVLADGTAPPRTSDRVLRVVFPAHIDSDGIYREESAAHAVVENAAWAEALGGQPRTTRGVPPLRPAGIVPAAAPGSSLATMDEIVAARAAGAKSAAAPAEFPPTASPANVPAPLQPRVLPSVVGTSFGTGSRSTSPISLAEAAAGLSAPRVTSLDPRAPAANYDTPDVTAVRAPLPRAARSASAASASSRPGAPPTITPPTSAMTASAAATPGAPYGSRPVRWKGRTYQLPYKNPQAASTSAGASLPAGNPTAELNKAALARTATQAPAATAVAERAPTEPTYGPTTDPREAQQRVQAMVAPVLSRAVEDGRDAAREAAPAGFALPLPRKGAPQ